MFTRSIESVLRRYASIYPAVVIAGPRQSGKSTLARSVFPDKPYISFEDVDARVRVQGDPRGFLAPYQEGAIFDEGQQVPELLSYLQGVIDEKRDVMGRFILTGSQHFVMSERITQSLVGRVGLLTLLPLSSGELGGKRRWEELALRGCYPAVYRYDMQPREFYVSYLSTYIERDVRQLKNIGDLRAFRLFLSLCAGRVGQLLNMHSLAVDCGIAPNTVRAWLSILEEGYIVHLVSPYYLNLGKRLTKMPKLYFHDTGLAAHLLNIVNEEQLRTHYLRGNFFENVVINELFKSRTNNGLAPNLYFWRDQTGREVDVVAEWEGTIMTAAIKASHSFGVDDLRHLQYFVQLAPGCVPHVIYAGDQRGMYQGVILISFDEIGRFSEK